MKPIKFKITNPTPNVYEAYYKTGWFWKPVKDDPWYGDSWQYSSLDEAKRACLTLRNKYVKLQEHVPKEYNFPPLKLGDE